MVILAFQDVEIPERNLVQILDEVVPECQAGGDLARRDPGIVAFEEFALAIGPDQVEHGLLAFAETKRVEDSGVAEHLAIHVGRHAAAADDQRLGKQPARDFGHFQGVPVGRGEQHRQGDDGWLEFHPFRARQHLFIEPGERGMGEVLGALEHGIEIEQAYLDRRMLLDIGADRHRPHRYLGNDTAVAAGLLDHHAVVEGRIDEALVAHVGRHHEQYPVHQSASPPAGKVPRWQAIVLAMASVRGTVHSRPRSSRIRRNSGT